MTAKGVEGTGKSSLLTGCSYGEVNPRDFIVLFRFANASFSTEKMSSHDISALCNGGQCSDLQASTNRDKISMSEQGYKLTQLKDGARRADVPFLLLCLTSMLYNADVLADSVLVTVCSIAWCRVPIEKDWWLRCYLEIFDSERFLNSQMNVLVPD